VREHACQHGRAVFPCCWRRGAGRGWELVAALEQCNLRQAAKKLAVWRCQRRQPVERWPVNGYEKTERRQGPQVWASAAWRGHP
jgi:hypothetical protein